jgi:hypothetical protein
MKQIVIGVILVLATVALSVPLTYSAIRQGRIEPPIGTLRLGPLTVMSLPPCPTVPGALVGAGRRCGSASPWLVWVIWREPDGEPVEWKVISMVLDGG